MRGRSLSLVAISLPPPDEHFARAAKLDARLTPRPQCQVSLPTFLKSATRSCAPQDANNGSLGSGPRGGNSTRTTTGRFKISRRTRKQR